MKRDVVVVLSNLLTKVSRIFRIKRLYKYSSDEVINSEINKRGYAVIQLLNQNEIKFLMDNYFSLKNDLGKGFHATMHSKDMNYRRNINKIIGSVFNKKVEVLLSDYKQLNSNYTVKEPGEASFFDFHLDWNMVDESRYRSITIWCPLVDTNPHNGNLWVLERSHTLGDSYRCGPGLYLYFKNPSELKKRKFKKVELQLKAGQAIIYDHKLFHGSPPNLTNIPRVAINQSMIPKGTLSRHYIREGELINGYDVDDDFYNRVMINGKNEYELRVEKIPIRNAFSDQSSVNQMIV